MAAHLVVIIVRAAIAKLAQEAAKRAAVKAAQAAVRKQLKKKIDDAIRKAQEQLKKEARDRKEKCPSCDEPKNPCKSLRKGDPDGSSPYKGGSYGGTKGQSGKGYESNHMPSSDANSGAAGLSKNRGPAIQMDKADHQKTKSWGRQGDAENWRLTQEGLIASGKIEKAFAMDVADVMRIAAEGGNVEKYMDAIAEAAAYLWCLKKHGLGSGLIARTSRWRQGHMRTERCRRVGQSAWRLCASP
jgi:hypothetical protein